MTTPQELKQIVSEGLLSFPVTDFDKKATFVPIPMLNVSSGWRLTARPPFLPPAVPASLLADAKRILGRDPHRDGNLQGQSTDSRRRGRPNARRDRLRSGSRTAGRQWHPADAPLPDRGSQEGIAAHAEQVCKSVPKIGVIIYNRANSRLNADMLERLADTCPNLIGFKDGVGEIENMVTIRRRLGDRFSYLGGLPTAEVYAAAYKALGVPVYSSAVFNFIPKTAMDFYRAIAADDHATVGKLIDEFFLPYLEDPQPPEGYAVSIVKAGAKLVGHSAGPVRSPLTDLNEEEMAQLDALIKKMGPQ